MMDCPTYETHNQIISQDQAKIDFELCLICYKLKNVSNSDIILKFIFKVNL